MWKTPKKGEENTKQTYLLNLKPVLSSMVADDSLELNWTFNLSAIKEINL